MTAVNGKRKGNGNAAINDVSLDPNLLNINFASVAIDPSYVTLLIID